MVRSANFFEFFFLLFPFFFYIIFIDFIWFGQFENRMSHFFNFFFILLFYFTFLFYFLLHFFFFLDWFCLIWSCRDGQYTEAIRCFKQAENAYEDRREFQQQGATLSKLCDCYQDQGR